MAARWFVFVCLHIKVFICHYFCKSLLCGKFVLKIIFFFFFASWDSNLTCTWTFTHFCAPHTHTLRQRAPPLAWRARAHTRWPQLCQQSYRFAVGEGHYYYFFISLIFHSAKPPTHYRSCVHPCICADPPPVAAFTSSPITVSSDRKYTQMVKQFLGASSVSNSICLTTPPFSSQCSFLLGKSVWMCIILNVLNMFACTQHVQVWSLTPTSCAYD